jgi:hypothetical protein
VLRVVFGFAVIALFLAISPVASPFVPIYRSLNRREFLILLWWITCMQKKTQLRLVAFVLFQGAFFAYGDCLYNSDLILLLLIILASGRLAMIDVASGERLNVLIILVISLAVYAFVPWIPRLLEKKPSLLRRLGAVSVDLERQKRTRSCGRGESGEGPGNDGTAVRDGSTKSPVVPQVPAARGKATCFREGGETKEAAYLPLEWTFAFRRSCLGWSEGVRALYPPVAVNPTCQRGLYLSKGIMLPQLLSPKPRWRISEFRLFMTST